MSWLEDGWRHVWLPYAQMQTAPLPLPAVRTEGSRIFLEDGRVLVDGIASWWTACHGYNHPHIRAAVERQLAIMPHVMFGGLVHEQALTLARRLSALLPGDLDRFVRLPFVIGRGDLFDDGSHPRILAPGRLRLDPVERAAGDRRD